MRKLFARPWVWLYFGTAALYFAWVLLMRFGARTPGGQINYLPTALTVFPILEVTAAGFMGGALLFARARKDWRDGLVLLGVAVVFVLLMLTLTGDALVRSGQFHVSQTWTTNYRYNLAADYEGFYYLYECDPAGITCRLLTSFALPDCRDVDLPLDPNTNTLYLRGDCGFGRQIIQSYPAR
ncbi:MAG: hypothetical protein HXY40_04285 [Chloroflexi bacterium]|nr:hypothetical protein [Chloroflexota bacterium]